MHSYLVRSVSALLSFCLVACSSTRAVPELGVQTNTPNSERQTTLNVGDEVTVVTVAKSSISLVLTRAESDALVGTVSGSELRLPFEQIVNVEVRRFDGLKTMGLAALIIVALFTLLL
jgi:hypothetical protein